MTCKHIWRGQEGRTDNEHICIKCGKVTLCQEVHLWHKDTWI